jgi:rhodanese-related sulfurtransferase
MKRVFVVLVLALLGSVVLSACGGGAESAGVQNISPVAYNQDYSPNNQHLLIDVRTPGEYAAGHIAGSVNIPVEELAGRLDEVPQGTPIVVYCRSGNRSATASRILVDAGYSNVYDLGGIIAWQSAGYPLQQ